MWALKIGGPILLLIGAVVGFRAYVASERADERKDVTGEFIIGQKQAEIADLKNALAEATSRVRITEGTNADLSESLTSGLAARDDYVERMLRTLRQRPAQSPGEAGVAGTAELAGGSDQATFVADVAICDENTKRLINAADWYEKQRALSAQPD